MRSTSGLRRDSAVPIHRQIAQQLAAEIGSGTTKAFDRLPSETELMQRFEVSRVTVRWAVDLLVESGTVVRKQGKGTFVAGPSIIHDLQDAKGIISELRSQRVVHERHLLEFSESVPPSRALMHGAEGCRFARIRRLYTLEGGVPFAVGVAHLRVDGSSLSRTEVETHSVYDLLRMHLRREVARTELNVSARRAGSVLGRELKLARTAPLLVFERVSFDADERAVEHTVFSVRAETYSFGLSVNGPMPVRRHLKLVV